MTRAKLRREKIARQANNQRYTNSMYCKDTFFNDAIEFAGSQAGWNMIAEPITGSS